MAGDAKTSLNQFIQKSLRKPIGKGDIVYTTQTFGTTYQSTVALICLEGSPQYAGETASTKKEAEQNAALIALQNHSDAVAALPTTTPGQGKKRKAGDAGLGLGVATPVLGGAAATGQNKLAVNNALSRILKRPLSKEDTVFQSVQTVGGWQCTLSMPGLPGEWAMLAWAGEVGANEKQAQDNACLQAMNAIQSDMSFAQLLAAPKVQKHNPKGKGKGKDFFGKGKGKGKGKGGFDGGMGGFDGGFGGGFGGGCGNMNGGMGMGGMGGVGGMGMGGMGGGMGMFGGSF